MERKAWYVVGAVLLSLGGPGAPELRAADGSFSFPTDALMQPHGKLGIAPVALDAAAVEDLERRLAAKGMKLGSPVFIRIFKAEAELEVWVEASGRFELFAAYPICNWSGTLGPKLSEGDKQSPEGLYSIGPRQVHHSARWRRSLDLGFPNTYDRSLKRTGSDVLLHGGCTSTGCYAMTDQAMEEIFRLTQAAFAGDQKLIQVHVFPFRMTADNLAAHASSEWSGFWTNLKEAYDQFEGTRLPGAVSVCNSRYVLGEPVSGDAGCTENVGTVVVPSARRARAARRWAGRNAKRARAARVAAKVRQRAKQRQAMHVSQRKLPK